MLLNSLFEFFRRFSERLRILIKRQNIFLIKDKDFEIIFNEKIGDKKIIKCHVCGSKLTIHNVMGWVYGNNEEMLFFCDDPICKINIEGRKQ
jgi:hypothetical protein